MSGSGPFTETAGIARLMRAEEEAEAEMQRRHELRQAEEPDHDREVMWYRCIDCELLGLTRHLLEERFGPIEEIRDCGA